MGQELIVKAHKTQELEFLCFSQVCGVKVIANIINIINYFISLVEIEQTIGIVLVGV